VVEVAGGYQLQTAEDNALWVSKLISSRPVRLTRPALECLAIIAYKQPVTRLEIDEVRGVDSGGVLKTLLEHGFIKIAGRKDVPGKPLIYTTDKRFMEFFRLKSLAELPTLRELAEIQEERLREAREQEAPGAECEEGLEAGSSPEPEQGLSDEEDRNEEDKEGKDLGKEESPEED
jgi:segregation and condensation protein B